ncbi:MAG: DUF550 domain-containing protein [Lachnospiraceae bacterium]|nr:DUF550 domain-containing protein [Lachnospiraceae bacterium]
MLVEPRNIDQTGDDLRMSDLFYCQQTLRAKHHWPEHLPDQGPLLLLWAYGEMGEVGEIIKKKGNGAVMNNPAVRRHFVEECGDVLMYLVDMMDSYGVTPEEISEAYARKWKKNMDRTWEENRKLYEDEDE